MPKNEVQFQRGMSLGDFLAQYGTEAQCEQALFAWRWPQGFACPECGHDGHCVFGRGLYQCQSCRRQTSVTAGTLFTGAKLPLTKWLLAIYLLTQSKNGISAMDLARQLGVSYNSAWLMKHRAQVLGMPVIINGRTVRDGGYQLRQLDELLRAHDLTTRLIVVDEQKIDQEIREDLIGNLKHAGAYVIVNYRRSEVGQQGGAHISPLGAYDADTDTVLVLDVNPSSAGWVWMPIATLITGMRTFDTVENRGYILVQPR